MSHTDYRGVIINRKTGECRGLGINCSLESALYHCRKQQKGYASEDIMFEWDDKEVTKKEFLSHFYSRSSQPEELSTPPISR